MRFNGKSRVRNITRVVMASAGAMALLLGIPSSANAAQGYGIYRVTISNIKLTVFEINDCEPGNCNVAEAYGFIQARVVGETNAGYDWIGIGSQSSPKDMTSGVGYYPYDSWGVKSYNGAPSNSMTFKAMGTSKIEVDIDGLKDHDWWSNDDEICDTVDHSGGVTIPTPWDLMTKGASYGSFETVNWGDGRCRLTFWASASTE